MKFSGYFSNKEVIFYHWFFNFHDYIWGMLCVRKIIKNNDNACQSEENSMRIVIWQLASFGLDCKVLDHI